MVRKMVEDFLTKERYGYEDLLKIMTILRSPGGCPWDREQTHASLRSNFIEETYEAVEAIDKEDRTLLEEELGDVLLQVVFHAEMEREKGSFDMGDVVDGICKKLIVRHPHVFGDVSAETSAQVLVNWDQIKRSTKGQKTHTEAINSVPRQFPALMRSRKVQEKAAKAGFDWKDISGVLAKTREELAELESAVASGDRAQRREELGDLLFTAVNLSRFLGEEPEEALTASCDKFVARFAFMESSAAHEGKKLEELTPEALDDLWEKAKEVL